MSVLDKFGFSKKQKIYFHQANAPINIADGAIRSGKTDVQRIKAMLYAYDNPGMYIALGRTLESVKNNLFEGPRGIFDWFGIDNFEAGRNRYHIGDSVIRLLGANNKRAYAAIMGSTLQGAIGDEATLLPTDMVKHLIGRCSMPKSRIYFTTNPDSPYHKFYTDFMCGNPDVYQLKFRIEDNPGLTQEYIERIKRQYTGAFYDRYIRGLWRQAEGIIYGSYDEGIHDYDFELDYWDRTLVGIDYGTGAPTCFVLIKVVDNVYYIDREYYYDSSISGHQKPDVEQVDDLEVFIEGLLSNRIWCDGSAASFMAEARKRKIKVYGAETQNATNRVRYIDSLYKQNRIRVHKRCKNVKQQNTTYIWDETQQAKGIDLPLKLNDHAMNAVEYPIYNDRNRDKSRNVR